MSQTIRLNVKFRKDDKQHVINCLTTLPVGIRLINQKELKKSHRFIFTATNYRLLNKLFTTLRKKVKHKYAFMPVNHKKLKP